ncbi:EamA-like transporter family protein [compost metagenome]
MPFSALALLITAGFIHAGWNIVAKRAGGDARFALFTSIFLALVWTPLGVSLAWNVVPGWGWDEWAVIFISGVLHVLYYVVLLRGYRKADLTVVYPLARGSGPLLSSMAALILLGEHISTLGVAGIAGVVLGVFLIAGGPKLFLAAKDPAQRRRVHVGIFYGLLTGAFIACYTVVDGYAVKFMLMSPILIDYMGNFIRIAVLAPVYFRDHATAAVLWKKQWKYALIVGAISPISYVLVLYAVKLAPLSHVAPAREVSMLFAAIIGGHLLKEGDRIQRLIGAIFIAVGVIALAIG